MTRYYILRTVADSATVEVLAGATILKNDPIWSDIGGGAIIQPMLFRDEGYAMAVLTIAKAKDEANNPDLSASYTLRRMADLSA